MHTKDIFELYKPLRNHLREISLSESLRVIWAYIQHLQLNNEIPDDIEVIPEFRFAKNKFEKKVFEWELEILAREIIINSPESIYFPKTIKKWGYFSEAVNKLKELENNIAGMFVDKTNILLELHRMAHRQFPWQLRPNSISMTRYFKIFSHAPLDKIMQKVIGLTTKELYLIEAALFGNYLNNFALVYPPRINIPEITQENLRRFLDRFSCKLMVLKQKLLSEQEMNEKFVYSYHSLRAYPIIEMIHDKRDCLVCPLPTLLFWRLTNGVYYEICREKDFDNAFGYSFQNYIGEVLKSTNINKKKKIYSEKEYYDCGERKDTIDWIADEEEAALFIECKTKRVTMPAKVELVSEEALDQDLSKMADFIVQVYKNINDYRNNKYPNYKFNKDKKIFPLIITLEEWFLFGDRSLEKISEKVCGKFDESRLPISWLDEMPYSICSTQEFEQMMQIIQNVGIQKFMSKKGYDPGRIKWNFTAYMMNDFPDELREVKPLFKEDFNKIFPNGLHGNNPP